MRDNLLAMATETTAIIKASGYRSPGGHGVRIAAGVKAAVAGTRLYLPDGKIPAALPRSPGTPVTEVTKRISPTTAGPTARTVLLLR